jgi:hypothetical protein
MPAARIDSRAYFEYNRHTVNNMLHCECYCHTLNRISWNTISCLRVRLNSMSSFEQIVTENEHHCTLSIAYYTVNGIQ